VQTDGAQSSGACDEGNAETRHPYLGNLGAAADVLEKQLQARYARPRARG